MMLKAGCALRSRPTALGLDAHLVLTLHDEIVFETRDELAENVVGIIEECLKAAFMGMVPEMPFELTMRIAEAWGD